MISIKYFSIILLKAAEESSISRCKHRHFTIKHWQNLPLRGTMCLPPHTHPSGTKAVSRLQQEFSCEYVGFPHKIQRTVK